MKTAPPIRAGIYSPTVSEFNRIDDPRHYPLQDPLSSSFTAFSPNGAHMRTDLNGSGDAFKVIYYSPRLIGVQISGSYTPELSRGLNDLFDGNDHFDEQSDIWEVGVNYQGALSGFDVGVYGGYVAGTNARRDRRQHREPSRCALDPTALRRHFLRSPFTPDDLEEWGAGAQVAYEGLKVGGSYRVTNIAGGAGLADKAIAPFTSVGCSMIAGCVLPDSSTTIWGAGATYETGPWRFGANYVNLEEELPAFSDTSVGPTYPLSDPRRPRLHRPSRLRARRKRAVRCRLPTLRFRWPDGRVYRRAPATRSTPILASFRRQFRSNREIADWLRGCVYLGPTLLAQPPGKLC